MLHNDAEELEHNDAAESEHITSFLGLISYIHCKLKAMAISSAL